MPEDWNISSLKEYFTNILQLSDKRSEERFNNLSQLLEKESRDRKESVAIAIGAQKEAIAAALAASKEAVAKAEIATEKRLEGMNEFRDTLKDQQSTFATRTELSIVEKALSDKLNDIGARLNRDDGKGIGASQLWGYIIGAVGLIATLIAIFTYLRK